MSLIDDEINEIISKQAEQTRQALFDILGGQAREVGTLKLGLEKHNSFEIPRTVGYRYIRTSAQTIPPSTTVPMYLTTLVFDTSILGSFRGQEVVFTGAGLNDMKLFGRYSGAVNPTYTVTIAGTGTPDTFDWNDGLGGSGTGVNCSTSAITLNNGVTVAFGATTGHTIGNKWVWKEPIGRYYANSAGYYQAGLSVSLDSVAASYQFDMTITKNFTTYLSGFRIFSTANISPRFVSVSGLFDMAIGDYIEFLLFHNHSTNLTSVAASSANQYAFNGWCVKE